MIKTFPTCCPFCKKHLHSSDYYKWILCPTKAIDHAYRIDLQYDNKVMRYMISYENLIVNSIFFKNEPGLFIITERFDNHFESNKPVTLSKDLVDSMLLLK